MAVSRFFFTMRYSRYRRRRIGLALGLVLGVLMWSRWDKLFPGTRRPPVCVMEREFPLQNAHKDPAAATCMLPKLDLNPPDIMKFFRKKEPIDCLKGTMENWVEVVRGRLLIPQRHVDRYGPINCAYTPIMFSTDYKVERGRAIKDVQNGDPVITDFFEVECKSKSGKTYRNIHASVASREDLTQRHLNKHLAPDSLGLDVLMFGFDSVSKMTWRRTLPKTRDYFLHTLGGLELDGYNIVGDGTPAALLPILTGLTEEELPEARRGHEGAKPVDGHPWIWKEFRDQGYVTMWGEDMPDVGTFQYRMLGFESPPVDHYMRPFQLVAPSFMRNSHCLGSRPQIDVFFNWFRDAATLYNRTRKFMFGFHSALSHNDNSPLQNADDLFVHFLSSLADGNHLHNALLILMSDHGSRFSNTRRTVQGKLEERMPYFAFRFPPWFETKYPEAMRNFRANLQRLTTPFDIHATFKDILHFPDAGVDIVSPRGISLFQEIPKTRTCWDASVEPHWCTCLEWMTVQTNCSAAQKAARVAVLSMNIWLHPVLNYCARLSLQEVLSVRMYTPNQDVLRFKGSSDRDGRVADFSDDMDVDEVLFQISMVTMPGWGHYEVTVNYNVKTKNVKVDPRDVSRINKHGKQSQCIGKVRPDLQRLCYCTS